MVEITNILKVKTVLTLTVAKMPSAVNVTANNIKFGEDAVINIAVPNVVLGCSYCCC